jgi:ribonuclease HII
MSKIPNITKTIKTRSPAKMLDLIYDINNKFELCLDEVGRGCLFGRAYIGCVVLPKDGSFDGKDIKDSKKFSSKKKIKEVAEYIKEHAVAWHIEFVEADLIDEINILQAVMRGMHSCIRNIINKLKEKGLCCELENDYRNEFMAIVDGNYFVPYRWYDDTKEIIRELPAVTVEQGDAKYMGIAAASILAKVARDEYIAELCLETPSLVEHYGLDTNVGYGTKKHMDGIKEHGITQWHRKSYKPCSLSVSTV